MIGQAKLWMESLAADILRTAIAPTWNDIGQLAAIALLRTGRWRISRAP